MNDAHKGGEKSHAVYIFTIIVLQSLVFLYYLVTSIITSLLLKKKKKKNLKIFGKLYFQFQTNQPFILALHLNKI